MMRHLARCCGYLAAAILMLALMLAVRFPGHQLHNLLEQRLSPTWPALACTIGPVHWSAGGLLLEHLAWIPAGTTVPLLRLDELRIIPRLERSSEDGLTLADWSATVYGGGELVGILALDHAQGRLLLTLRLRGLQLATAEALQHQLNRPFSGNLDGHGRLVFSWPSLGLLKGQLQMSLSEAGIALRQPLLGMELLMLERLDVHWNLDPEHGQRMSCSFQSTAGTGDCSGHIDPLPAPAWGQLALAGQLIPVDAPSAVLPFHRRGAWPFNLEGTLVSPLIRWN